MAWPLFIFLFSCLLSASAQQQCGRDGGGDLRTLFPNSTYEEMLKHRGSDKCKGSFYTYEAFIAAANRFPDFAAVGDEKIRKREIAAFFGQTSQETTGGWDSAPDGRFAWGYCFVEEVSPSDCCYPSIEWPCVAGKTYCGRGPIQLTWNYNYGPAGAALGYDLLTNPDLVAGYPTVSFETALWFWMTPQPPKPSCHDVITGIWTPSTSDCAARRYPGYGVITNIINGGLECGIGEVITAEYRIGFYKRYCDIFGLEYGDNLDCNDQQSFGTGLSSSAI